MWLAWHDPATTVDELQALLDRFHTYYNEVRPHRAIGRRPPAEACAARPKDHPRGPVIEASYRVRKDRDRRRRGRDASLRLRLMHIKVGSHAGTRPHEVLSALGNVKVQGWRETGVNDVSRHLTRAGEDSNLRPAD